MAATARKTDPALWNVIKNEVTQGDRGGKPGQWSARKAQLAAHEYKKRGGTYQGAKDPDNHLQQWTDEAWGTASGAQSGKTGERYLPERARERLSKKEYAETTAKKQDDTKKGKQFSDQPPAIARKTAQARHNSGPKTSSAPTDLASLKRADLMDKAARSGITGRSRMSKSQLIEALS